MQTSKIGVVAKTFVKNGSNNDFEFNFENAAMGATAYGDYVQVICEFATTLKETSGSSRTKGVTEKFSFQQNLELKLIEEK